MDLLSLKRLADHQGGKKDVTLQRHSSLSSDRGLQRSLQVTFKETGIYTRVRNLHCHIRLVISERDEMISFIDE